MLNNGPLHLLGQADFVAGATPTVDLAGARTHARDGRMNYIVGLYFELYESVTAAATSAAVTARQMLDVLAGLRLTDAAGQQFLFRNPFTGGQLACALDYIKQRARQTITAVNTNSDAVWTRTIELYVPFWNQLWEDPLACIQPLARLRNGKMHVQWCAATTLGTGQTIGATTRLRLYAHVVPRTVLDARAELELWNSIPAVFVGDRVPVDGKLVALAVKATGATATLASNDFTALGIEGNVLDIPRGTDPDLTTRLYNRHLMDLAAELTVPTTGTIESFPVFTVGAGARVSGMPVEGKPEMYLTTGAGNPAVGDQEYIGITLKPKDPAKLANAYASAGMRLASGASGYDAWLSAIQRGMGAANSGMKGSVGSEHSEAPWLPSPILTA